MKIPLIIILLLFWFTQLNAQTVFTSMEAVRDSIKSKTTDRELNHFLIKSGMVSFKESDKAVSDPSDTVSFSVSGIRMDIFRKNLFGTKEEEIIMQLRQKNRNTINVFYRSGKELRKVPGYIEHYSNIYMGYSEESFIFYFENIAGPGLYSIITKSQYTYNRHFEQELSIWDIQADTINRIYNTLLVDFTYSGLLRFTYDTKREIKFLNKSYPKTLVVEQETVNYADMEFTQEMDTISGVKTTEKWTKEIHFTYGNSGLEIEKTKDNMLGTMRKINKKE